MWVCSYPTEYSSAIISARRTSSTLAFRAIPHTTSLHEPGGASVDQTHVVTLAGRERGGGIFRAGLRKWDKP